jgi:protein-disulfide isomerase
MALMLTLVIWLSLIAQTAGQTLTPPLAEVDGMVITAAEIENRTAFQLSRLEEQINDLKRRAVEELIDEKLLEKEAAKRGLSVKDLLETEVKNKTDAVTELSIDGFYHINKARIKGDEAEAREKIRTYLQNQNLQARKEAFLESLRSQAKVITNLPPPRVFRVDVKADGAPVKGKADAPVTIVEFTDFHCPFCKRVLPTLDELESRYGDKIRIVFRDFPIDSLHPEARKGHEAARCANEQGKFWPFHDKIFANAPKVSVDDLKAYAKQVDMDVEAFERCFASGKYRTAVEKDIDDGKSVGVTGTPAFIINGRTITGARSLDFFTQVIDEELARPVRSTQ